MSFLKTFFKQVLDAAGDSHWNGFYGIAFVFAYLSAPAFVPLEGLPFVYSALLVGASGWLAVRVSTTKDLSKLSPQVAHERRWRISALPMIAVMAAGVGGLAGFFGSSPVEVFRLWTGIFVFGGYLLFGDVRDWGSDAVASMAVIDAKTKDKEDAVNLLRHVNPVETLAGEAAPPPAPRRRSL